MSRIREEEKCLLKLVSELEENLFQERFDMPKEGESCFSTKEDTDYITDYGFETPVELKNILTKMWKEEVYGEYLLSAVPCITAAVFKSEPECAEERGQKQSSIEVPMFIYNF